MFDYCSFHYDSVLIFSFKLKRRQFEETVKNFEISCLIRYSEKQCLNRIQTNLTLVFLLVFIFNTFL